MTIGQYVSILGGISGVNSFRVVNIIRGLIIVIVIIPVIYLIKCYYEVSQQDTSINKNKTILPPSDKLIKIYFFVIGKLLALPGLLFSVYKYSCQFALNDSNHLVNFYSKDLSCFFTSSFSEQILGVLWSVILMMYPFAGYVYNKLEFDRKIKNSTGNLNIK